MQKYPHPATATEERLNRVYEAAECRTQQELASFLHIRQSSISDAKRRGSVPAEWLITLLRKKWINPFWILTGEGTRLLQPCDIQEACPVCRAKAQEQTHAAEGREIEKLALELVRKVAAALAAVADAGGQKT